MTPIAQADTVILASPTNLVAMAISNSQVNLTWTDNANNEIGYSVERKAGNGAFMIIANLVANSTTYTDSGLSGNTTYTYRVQAIGNGSNISSSGYSAESSITTGGGSLSVLSTPGNLVATAASSSQVTLTWIDNATGETGYIVERATGSGTFSMVGLLASNSMSFPDTGLVYNTTYSYRVQARGDGIVTSSSAFSNIATITMGNSSSGLLAPTNLTASAVSQTQIYLSWTDNAVNESGYIVERAVGSGAFGICAYLSANTQTFSDTGLTNNTIYRYRVMARGDGTILNNSAYSNEVTATTGASTGVLPTPTNLIATTASATQINLSWSDNAGNESGYLVERAAGNGAFSLLAYLSANSQSFSDSGLTANITYKYRVQAMGNGTTTYNSAYSNEATPGGTVSSLGAPTGLTATAATSTQINLVWTDNATAETGYTVERATGSDTFAVLANLGANAQTFSDTGLTAGTVYRYRVQARDNSSTSAYSNEVSATAGGQSSGILNPPAYLMATCVSECQINLAWTDNSSGESGYNVERRTEGGAYSIIAYLAADVQSYSDLGLLGGTTYTYRVLARGNGTTIPDSTYSSEASATTQQGNSKQTILRFYIGRMYYYLNDEGQFMDAAPVIQSNRTLLPITYAALPLGVEVDWNPSESKVTLTKGSKVIQLWIGKNQASVNGEKQYIDANNAKVVPAIVNGRTMLPLAFVALTLDCQVDWDATAQEVKITYPKP